MKNLNLFWWICIMIYIILLSLQLFPLVRNLMLLTFLLLNAYPALVQLTKKEAFPWKKEWKATLSAITLPFFLLYWAGLYLGWGFLILLTLGGLIYYFRKPIKDKLKRK